MATHWIEAVECGLTYTPGSDALLSIVATIDTAGLRAIGVDPEGGTFALTAQVSVAGNGTVLEEALAMERLPRSRGRCWMAVLPKIDEYIEALGVSLGDSDVQLGCLVRVGPAQDLKPSAEAEALGAKRVDKEDVAHRYAVTTLVFHASPPEPEEGA